MDLVHPTVKSGDLMVVPSWTTGLALRPDAQRAILVPGPIESIPNRYFATMSASIGAAFYSSARGPLPFGIGKVKPDVYEVFMIR